MKKTWFFILIVIVIALFSCSEEYDEYEYGNYESYSSTSMNLIIWLKIVPCCFVAVGLLIGNIIMNVKLARNLCVHKGYNTKVFTWLCILLLGIPIFVLVFAPNKHKSSVENKILVK